MKNFKPIYLLVGGSIIIFMLTFLFLLMIDREVTPFPEWVLFGLPVTTAIVAYLVFYFSVKYFLSDRLRILYRAIRKGQVDNNVPKIKLSKDIVSQVQNDAKNWSDERNAEISRLKEQEEFRREFLGNLAHELKTPIFSIQGYILTLLDGGLEDPDVNILFLERASKATERMVNIIEDLDQITKLEDDTMKLEIRPFDITELAKEVFDSLELMAAEKNIKLKLDKDYGSIFVDGDKGKISQVFINLISNSIFYGNKNGHTVVRFYPIDDLVTVEVSDDGPGIDGEHIPRLFERFYRVEKSRNRNEGGSGLGLAIVKKIIESHGQTISVRSTVGVGSTFTFSLDKSKHQAPSLYSSRGVQIK